MNERISSNPHICQGQACIKGTRIPFYQIIRMLANGDKIEELLEDYPLVSYCFKHNLKLLLWTKSSPCHSQLPPLNPETAKWLPFGTIL